MEVVVGVCVHRDIKMRTWRTLSLLKDCPNIKVTVAMQEGDALISRSRNKLATKFLKETTADYLMFIDDDIEIDPYDATRMMQEAYAYKYPILGAAYPVKDQENPTLAIMTKDKQGRIKFGKEGSVIQVDCVSTGCMLIDRRTLERMVKKEAAHFCDQGYYTFFQHREMKINGKWDDCSEDWFFCRQAKELGMAVWLDTRPKLTHIGPFNYTWDLMMLNGQFKKHDNIVLNYDLTKPTV